MPSHRRWFPLGLVALASIGAAACQDDSQADDDAVVGDATPPDIEHTPVDAGQAAGQAVEVRCTVTDDQGVGSVTLFMRATGTEPWAARFFTPVDGTDDWAVRVEGSDITTAGVDYYIQATDTGSPRGTATSPDDAPASFYSFSTRIVGGGLPFVEGFEGEQTLEERGWTRFTQGFPHYDWELTDETSFSGTGSAWHTDGIAGLAGPLQDWLISPPLDLTGATDVSVSWFELGRFTSDHEVHALLVSVGSADAWEGGFVPLVEALDAPPDGEWGASPTIDLSAYAGNEAVFLAWYYEGTWPADRWFIDDVYVGAPTPRYQVGEVVTDPVDFGPGDTVQLTLSIDNVSDVDGDAVSASLGSEDPLVTVAQAAATWPAIPAGSSAASDAPFVLEVDPSHPDNAYVDLVLHLQVGEAVIDLPLVLRMGEGSTARVTADAGDSGALVLRLGAGDPDAPAFETGATATADGSVWELDLTGQAALLPPGAGDARWFVEARNDGLYEARLTGVEITWGGALTVASGVPVAVPPRQSVVVVLPDPPALVATIVLTEPEVVEPGDGAVQVRVTIRNDGAPTAGPLTGVLESADPDATVTGAGPWGFGDAALGTGEAAESSGAFGIDVSASHRDDSDLQFVLRLDDGVEAFEVPVAVPVPWAHAVLASVALDDGFAGDGYLDRGEDVELDVTVTNDGDLPTAGPVTVTLAVSPSSQAAVTLALSSETFGEGPIDAGASVEVRGAFELSVDAGHMGDLVVLDATLTDGVDTWTEEITLAVADHPWTAIAGAADPAFDANAYMFDLSGASYRSDGEVLWLRLESHTPYDPATAFADVHLYNAPSWWALEYVYEEFRLRDDNLYGDVVEPALPLVWETGEDWLAVRVALDDLGIIGHSTNVAFASGVCAYIWYCDVAPDPWFMFDFELGAIYFYNTEMVSIAW